MARYAGLTRSPDESGLKPREKGLAKAGNARVRGGPIQLAWRFLVLQKDGALARRYRTGAERRAQDNIGVLHEIALKAPQRPDRAPIYSRAPIYVRSPERSVDQLLAGRTKIQETG